VSNFVVVVLVVGDDDGQGIERKLICLISFSQPANMDMPCSYGYAVKFRKQHGFKLIVCPTPIKRPPIKRPPLLGVQ